MASVIAGIQGQADAGEHRRCARARVGHAQPRDVEDRRGLPSRHVRGLWRGRRRFTADRGADGTADSGAGRVAGGNGGLLAGGCRDLRRKGIGVLEELARCGLRPRARRGDRCGSSDPYSELTAWDRRLAREHDGGDDEAGEGRHPPGGGEEVASLGHEQSPFGLRRRGTQSRGVSAETAAPRTRTRGRAAPRSGPSPAAGCVGRGRPRRTGRPRGRPGRIRLPASGSPRRG